MNTILSKNVNTILYNHQIPIDFSQFVQSFLIIELGTEMKMEQERPKEYQQKLEAYGRTYPVYEVIYSLAEYIKFIILNNSRGNYNIKRGFEYQEDIINSKNDYCLYLKYIFDTMKVKLDYTEIQKQIGKRRLIPGDTCYANLIYEFLQNYVLEELKIIKEKGLVTLGSHSIYLTNYKDDMLKSKGFQKNGIETYNNIPNQYKEIYCFMKELRNLNSVKHIHNDNEKLMEYQQDLNLYYDLWFTTKYARAQNRRASKEELTEIETEYKRFYINKGIKDIISLEEKKQQFIQKSYEISEYEI